MTERGMYADDSREELEERLERFSRKMGRLDIENMELKDRVEKMKNWCPLCKRPRL